MSGKPSPPQDLKVSSIDNKRAVLSWSPPEFNGGSAVTGYAIEKKDTSSNNNCHRYNCDNHKAD